ncbi:MAG: rRNA cytosine-C5-methyltransferase [Bacteroides sp.]|nr:rRNA cytosine-C5-methyltransferase [Bacteroides sp.]
MNLPEQFIVQAESLLGKDEASRLLQALATEQPTSIRLNSKRLSADGWRKVAEEGKQIPWTTDGYYLSQRPAFTFDPLLHAGCYYVQEASSMFVEQAMRRYASDAPLLMLDLCAAPGGKSTLLRSLLPEGSLLVANEVIRNRSQVLAENLTKWGDPDVIVTNNDPSDFTALENCFDAILTDVPCSGEGMFRKDPVAVSEWSSENVEICYQRQRRILTDVWPALKAGGLLIYSTCTYNTKENEENVRWICRELGADVLPLDVPEEWKVTGNLLPDETFPVYRFLPHRTTGEGFFMAVMRKRSSAESDVNPSSQPLRKNKKEQQKKKPQIVPTKEQLTTIRQWVKADDEYVWQQGDGVLSLFPRRYESLLTLFRNTLRIVQAGVQVAELKGKEWQPVHALAMSTLLRQEAFPTEEVSYEQAIAYLRKEAITLPTEAPRGILLLTYRQQPIGFVKNIGNRANNLYPQEWRIRTTHLSEPVEVLV